jgi:hypothetical protein
LLASLAVVDAVVICDSHSAAQIEEALAPDFSIEFPSAAAAGANEAALFEATPRR